MDIPIHENADIMEYQSYEDGSRFYFRNDSTSVYSVELNVTESC